MNLLHQQSKVIVLLYQQQEHSALLFFSSNHMYKEYMSATYVGVGYENQKTMNLADHLKKRVGLG